MSAAFGRARIAATFAALQQKSSAALVLYFTAGDGGADATIEQIVTAAEAGADVIELGVPFSDPSADGPVIEAAMVRALAAREEGGGGMRPDTIGKTLAIARAVRARVDVPIVLFGYYNPLLQRGTARVIEEARTAGVDGLLVVDLPPEHDDALGPQAESAGLASIRLLAPTTDVERACTIAARGSGFLYYVSIAGVTGAASLDPSAVGERLAALKPALGALPVVAGFGVRTPADVARLAPFCDGVVVGSAIVKQLYEDRALPRAEQLTRLAATVRALKAACRGA